jgi:hypothetical protein
VSGFYKVLNADLTSRNGGTYQWVVGKWARKIRGTLVPCHRGYHVCQENDLLEWLGPVICEAEIGGGCIRASDETVARTARIVRVLDTWNERTARLFACDCAERVLPVFERVHPNDNRPREAVETARRFANCRATATELAAARAAARDAAWAPARDAAWAAAWAAAGDAAGAAAGDAARAAAGAAAWDAAGAAAWDAARAAAWDATRGAAWAAARTAAGAAAWAAAWDATRGAAWDATRGAAWAAARTAAGAAAWDAERQWQTQRLMECLRGERGHADE